MSLNRRQVDRAGHVGHVALGVEDLEDAAGRGAGLRHLRDDEPELAHGEEDVDQVQAELLPLAEGERAGDDLPAAEVEHGDLAQVGDEEDDGEEERERARDVNALCH